MESPTNRGGWQWSTGPGRHCRRGTGASPSRGPQGRATALGTGKPTAGRPGGLGSKEPHRLLLRSAAQLVGAHRAGWRWGGVVGGGVRAHTHTTHTHHAAIKPRGVRHRAATTSFAPPQAVRWWTVEHIRHIRLLAFEQQVATPAQE
jgi:hypothetical protein